MRTQVWINDAVFTKALHGRRTSDGPHTIVIEPTRKMRRTWFTDEWPVLERSTVPALTDDEWFVSPGDGWRLAGERTGANGE